jgi:lactoylglutathione lyase
MGAPRARVKRRARACTGILGLRAAPSARPGRGSSASRRSSLVAIEEVSVPFRINHIHHKATDPRRTADWYEKAFAFKIVSDETRAFGDRFVRCQSEDGGMFVNISGPRSGELLGPGDASAHYGLEHFGFDTTDIEADIARLEQLGAQLIEGPIQVPNGPRIAFLRVPDDVRVELIESR